MFDIEKNIYFNQLYDLYHEVLSSQQNEVIKDYYILNLSLSEIADELSISRNAVYDALKKGEESLINFENKLHLLAKQQHLNKILKDNLSLKNYQKIINLLQED